MGMPDLEKVIRGLATCGGDDPDCQNCPYYGEHGNGFGCETIMQRDALVLLKAQEPRVMTLEEVFERSKHMDEDAVWIEFEDEDGDMVVRPAILSNSKLIFEAEYSIVAALKWEKRYFPLGTYSKTWRCWTSRPTGEQRKAVPRGSCADACLIEGGGG